jgi:hypothetical protein
MYQLEIIFFIFFIKEIYTYEKMIYIKFKS